MSNVVWTRSSRCFNTEAAPKSPGLTIVGEVVAALIRQSLTGILEPVDRIEVRVKSDSAFPWDSVLVFEGLRDQVDSEVSRQNRG